MVPPRPAPLGSALTGPALTDRVPAVVIGVGNEFRRDDGAGPAVIARLIVHAIEAADLTQDPGLSPPVAAAVDTVTRAVLADLDGQPSERT